MLVTEALVISGLCKSKTEARRFIEAGAIKIQDLKIDDPWAEMFVYENKVLIKEFGKNVIN